MRVLFLCLTALLTLAPLSTTAHAQDASALPVTDPPPPPPPPLPEGDDPRGGGGLG